jgi:hypothetical protein
MYERRWTRHPDRVESSILSTGRSLKDCCLTARVAGRISPNRLGAITPDLFFAAVSFALATGITLAAAVRLFSSAEVEVVAGIVFVLYGETSIQLSGSHSRLEVLQRYLLANSHCETLDGDERSNARAALIQEISHPFVVQNP